MIAARVVAAAAAVGGGVVVVVIVLVLDVVVVVVGLSVVVALAVVEDPAVAGRTHRCLSRPVSPEFIRQSLPMPQWREKKEK